MSYLSYMTRTQHRNVLTYLNDNYEALAARIEKLAVAGMDGADVMAQVAKFVAEECKVEITSDNLDAIAQMMEDAND